MFAVQRFAWGVLVVGIACNGAFGADANVRSYGAVGDGKADDTEALQKAVLAGRGGIRLDKGIYRITSTILVDLDQVGYTSFTGDGTAQLVMAGPGPAIRFVGTHQGTAGPASFKANVWQRQRTPQVDGLEIVGEHPEADGIEADGTMQLTLTRCVIRKVRHGVHLVRRNRNVLIAACHIYENSGVGIFYDNVSLHQTNIAGCHISYCGGGGFVSRGGDVRNVQIGTCDIESNHRPDGPPTANILLDSTGGSIGEVAITGCTVQHNSKSPNSANIRILGRGDGGAKLGPTQEGNVTIGDNVLSDVRVNIDIQNARGVTITGNTFWMGYDHHLLVENSSNIVVGPNALDRNPRYAYGDSLQATNDLVFRNCSDCTLQGLHVNGVHKAPAGVAVENGRRLNITGCSILDCEGVGLLLTNLTQSRVSDCLVRDDRKTDRRAVSLKVVGGKDNMIVNNLLSAPAEIPAAAGVVRGNVTGE